MNVEYFNNYGAGKELILLNMDEVPVYYDIQRNSTYHWKGDKSIKVIRTNGKKKRITVCLGILSNGKKLPPMVIFKGKKIPTNPYSKHLVVKSNCNAWITEKLMLEWVEEVYNK